MGYRCCTFYIFFMLASRTTGLFISVIFNSMLCNGLIFYWHCHSPLIFYYWSLYRQARDWQLHRNWSLFFWKSRIAITKIVGILFCHSLSFSASSRSGCPARPVLLCWLFPVSQIISLFCMILMFCYLPLTRTRITIQRPFLHLWTISINLGSMNLLFSTLSDSSLFSSPIFSPSSR